LIVKACLPNGHKSSIQYIQHSVYIIELQCYKILRSSQHSTVPYIQRILWLRCIKIQGHRICIQPIYGCIEGKSILDCLPIQSWKSHKNGDIKIL
jgi:hypothetical protein